jgi:hypothetical protein
MNKEIKQKIHKHEPKRQFSLSMWLSSSSSIGEGRKIQTVIMDTIF